MRDIKDDILRLTKGKSTRHKVGSRAIAHRLNQAEQKIFETAIQNGYLVIKKPIRQALRNSFEDYMQSAGFSPIVVDYSSKFLEQIGTLSTPTDLFLGIDLQEYTNTRNFLDGAVTRMSPYITRGLVHTTDLWQKAKEVNNIQNEFIDCQFLKELAWREYFLRVRQNIGNGIFEPIFRDQKQTSSNNLPESVVAANTGISTIDKEIDRLYSIGYIHNHSRLWIASLVANIAQTNWQVGAKWMYYHLLDGELSSNYLSWQWVANTFSSKPYLVKQDNINFFAKSNLQNTFLENADSLYQKGEVPKNLVDRIETKYSNNVLQIKSEKYDTNVNTIVFSPWTLGISIPDQFPEYNQKILLLEPNHFENYPVSGVVLGFILGIALKIKGIKIVVSDFENLHIPKENLLVMENINTPHWIAEKILPQKYLFPKVSGYFTNFSSYWKHVREVYSF